MRRLRTTLIMGFLLGLARDASALSRQEVMVRAKAICGHPWTCTTANLTASCDAGYQSVYTPGDYLGLPYDWGGYMTLFEFDQQIAQGYGAGSYPADDVLQCTSGLDCSGFVSQCWGVGHNTTSSLPDISTPIQQADLLPGDILNQAGYHVVLFSHLLGNGDPVIYEAVGYNAHYSATGGWSYLSGYLPRRHDDITGQSAGNPVGTPDQPIVISAFPYTDSRSTAQSSSSVLDGCAAAASTDESGPEVVYQVTFTSPGQLTVSVSDDVGVDIDVHLYTSLNTNDCIARDDSTFTQAVDCGTYYIVADTYNGAAQAGDFTLTVDFQPSTGACGAGPPTYDFEGQLGDPCGNPNTPDLPFCNENLGAEVCLYNASTSWCTKACSSASDCTHDFPGGCCEDIGQGEHYCIVAAECTPTTPDAGVPDGGVTPGSDGGVTPGSDGGVAPGSDGAVAPGSDGGVTPGVDGGGAPPDGDGGCGCSSGAAPTPSLVWLLLVLGWIRRRR